MTLVRMNRVLDLFEIHRNAEGFPKRPATSGNAVWAILAAHGANPSTHEEARANAQILIDSHGFDRILKSIYPCIVMGIPSVYRYFHDGPNPKINYTLGPFRPACVDHGTDYLRCSNRCIYGLQLGGAWVDEMLD